MRAPSEHHGEDPVTTWSGEVGTRNSPWKAMGSTKSCRDWLMRHDATARLGATT